MKKAKTSTIISEIKVIEDTIEDCYHRVGVLEKKLISKYVSLEEREKLEKELESMRKVLEKNELDLKKLQKENSKSFAVAAIILFLLFLLYGLFSFSFL